MEFENGVPKRQIVSGFSVFAAIECLANCLNTKTEKVLVIAENVNRIVVSLVLNTLFSSIVLITPDFINIRLIGFVIAFAVSYGITYIIEILTKKIYQPRYYDRTKMNTSDVINKILGPNQSWDIVNNEESILRNKIESRIYSLFSNVIIVFLLSILISVLIDNGNPLKSRLNADPMFDGYIALGVYFILLFWLIQLSFSLKQNHIDKYIYCFLSLGACTIFGYYLSLSYFQLFLSF